jgi:hypothetical protein
MNYERKWLLLKRYLKQKSEIMIELIENPIGTGGRRY